MFIDDHSSALCLNFINLSYYKKYYVIIYLQLKALKGSALHLQDHIKSHTVSSYISYFRVLT